MPTDRSTLNEGNRQSAEKARRLVLDQHLHLRRLLMMGLAHARATLSDATTSHEPFHALVAEIRGVFVRHLADEEALLFPILEDDLPLGPRRAELIREEHTRQRGELEILYGWTDDGSGGRELAARFSQLAAALIEDIAHEEREVLIPEVIRDDQVVVDQSGG